MKVAILLLALVSLAHGHHGQDFFVTLDARVPAAGDFTLFSTAAVGEHDTSLETGMLAGLGKGLAVGAIVHFSDRGSLHAGGIAPFLQWSAPVDGTPFRVGAAVLYHFHDASRGVAGGGHSHGGHSHGGHSHRRRAVSPRDFTVPFMGVGPGFNPDAPPPPIGGTPAGGAIDGHPSTIHLHDTDFLLARLIVECALGPSTRLVGNVILGGTSRSDLGLGYALALRHEWTPKWAVGLEGIGDFNTHGYHELVASVIHSPCPDLGLRLGIGQGLGSASKGRSLLGGFTWRF